MPLKNQDDVDHIRESINTLASKNNTSLIFFSIFLLYILISVLNTSDLMLLLPEHTFKIGDLCKYIPKKSGYFYAYANDAWNFYENNRGSVTLKITRLN